MADTAITTFARSPLHDAATPGGSWDAPLTLSLLPFQTILNLRGDLADPAFGTAVASVLKVAPPAEPNTMASADGTRFLWLGPDEWLVITESDDASVADSLRSALGQQFAAVVDLSDNYTGMALEGEPARKVLEKGWTLDLHPRAFGPGQCAQSHLGHAPAILQQISDRPAYTLHVRPSFARYTWDWLVDASQEFGLRID